jgi:hypothetical protein
MVKKLVKPPFKAKPDDKIFCLIAGHVVSVDAYCHGWALRNQLCKYSATCEPYLEYAEHRLKDLSAKWRKIRLPPKTMRILEAKTRAECLMSDEFVAKTILENVREVKA